MLHVAQPTDAGVARCVADTAIAQAAAGWQVDVACPGGGKLEHWLAGTAVRHLPVMLRREPGASVLAEVRAVRRILRAVPYDLLHLHSSKAGLVGRLAGRGRVPTVFQPHAWSFHATNGRLTTAARLWERVATRWTDVVLCVSHAEEREARDAGLRGRFAVLPNGVRLDDFPAGDDAARAEAREKLAVPVDVSLAVCIGRLARQKGQDVLVQAWPLVRERVPAACLVLVGDGPSRAEFDRREEPGVRLNGPSDDAGVWLRAADVVVLPSRWEGLPLVLLEAMASSRSVVASDVGGVAEVLGADAGTSECGAIVAPGDVPALAAAVVARFLDRDLAHREGVAGRHRIERHYRLERQLRDILSLSSEIGARAA